MVLRVKNLPDNAGGIRNMGSHPGLGRCPGGGHGNQCQCSCLENPMDRGAWQATVHRIAELDRGNLANMQEDLNRHFSNEDI